MKAEDFKWSLAELITVLGPKVINEIEFNHNEVKAMFEGKHYNLLVDYKFKQHGFVKSIDLAFSRGVSRQEISQLLNRKKSAGQYEIERHAGCVYVKAIVCGGEV